MPGPEDGQNCALAVFYADPCDPALMARARVAGPTSEEHVGGGQGPAEVLDLPRKQRVPGQVQDLQPL